MEKRISPNKSKLYLNSFWKILFILFQTYCGFYKHQIEANLVDAEVLFEALGYTNIGNGLLVLDGPVCVDRVMAVSKDCLVAYVECQVISPLRSY